MNGGGALARLAAFGLGSLAHVFTRTDVGEREKRGRRRLRHSFTLQTIILLVHFRPYLLDLSINMTDRLAPSVVVFPCCAELV